MAYIMTKLNPCISIDAIVTIHYFEYASTFSFPGESHDFWELVYADKCEVEICSGTNHFILHKGEMVFHQPNEFHSIRAINTKAPNIIVISFDSHSDAMSFFSSKIFLVNNEIRRQMNIILSEAIATFSTPLNDPLTQQLEKRESIPFGAEQLIKMTLESLLIELVRLNSVHSEEKGRTVTTINRVHSESALLSSILTYFNDNICLSLTIKDICRANLISYSQLKYLFQQHFGCSALSYFNLMKLNAAKQMIREEKMNMTEIADALGFSSVHYFSRQFKLKTGMTPTQYASSVLALSEFDTTSISSQEKT